MSLRRPWLLMMLAGWSWASVATAQDNASGQLFGNPGGTAPGTTPPPAQPPTTNSGNTSDTTPPDDTPQPPPKPPTTPPTDTGTKPSNPFGFDNPTPDTSTPRTPLNGASTTFGTEKPATQGTEDTGSTSGTKPGSDQNAPSFSAPGLLGSLRQSFSGGEGRFAKPKYKYGVSLGMGFDSNYEAVPDITGRAATEVTQVVPAVQEVDVFQNVREFAGIRRAANGSFVPFFRITQRKIVLRPFQPEQTIVTPIPGIPMTPQASSIVSTGNVYFNTQFVKARSALTFDLRLGTEYYWDRKKDPADFTGNMSLLYVRKLTPRMQFTANASVVHQSQPDFTLVNVNSNNNVGHSFSNAFLKFDLTYRWSPRFSTDTSVNVQALYYDDKAFTAQNFYETTLSNEFRYIKSRKLTYVLELRTSTDRYPDAAVLDSSTQFVLIGLDQQWNSRLGSTFRVGEAVRSFDAGGSQSTPYAEISVGYKPSSRAQIALTSRYGFESTSLANQENITFRTSLSYTRRFSYRLSGSASINYVDSQVTTTGVATANGLVDTTDSQTTTDAQLTLAYQATKRLNLNANLSYTLLKTNLGLQDYSRTRFFLTGSYDF